MDPYESPASSYDISGREYPKDESLRVEHFVLYAAGVAVACGFDPFIPQAIAWLNIRSLFSFYTLEPFIHGAGIAAIGLLVLRRFQCRPSFPIQFGHWLLLMQGASWLAQFAYPHLHRYVELQALYHPDGWTGFVNVRIFLLTIYCLFWLPAVVVPALAVYYSKGQPVWQVLAGLQSITMFWLGLQPFFGRDDAMIWIAGAMLLGLITFVLFFAAAIYDVVQRQTRDQLHWTGIAFQVGVTLVLRLLRFV
jgi:hypothetical protein